MAHSPPESPSNRNSLARVIGNNDPPTLEECELASQTLQNIDEQLNGLQDEITALQATLARLQSRHGTLKATKEDQIAPILSLWRKLPLEILSNIL